MFLRKLGTAGVFHAARRSAIRRIEQPSQILQQWRFGAIQRRSYGVLDDIKKRLQEDKKVQEALGELKKTMQSEKISETTEKLSNTGKAAADASTSVFESVRSAVDKARSASANTASRLAKSDEASAAKRVADDVRSAASETTESVKQSARDLKSSFGEKLKEAMKDSEYVQSVKAFKKDLSDSDSVWKARRAIRSLQEKANAADKEPERVREEDLDTTTTAVQMFQPKDTFFNRMKNKLQSSGNPVVRAGVQAAEKIGETVENVTDRVFGESESAQALRRIQEIDYLFDMQRFQQRMQSEIVPNVVNAYISMDMDALRQWCAEPSFRIVEAMLAPRIQLGQVSKGKLLTLGSVEYMEAKMHDDSPIILMSAMAQQIECYEDGEGHVVDGAPDNIRAVVYVFAMHQDVESGIPEWKVLEFVPQMTHFLV